MTTGSRYEASIEADAKVPIIRITRDFDATPAELMRAHTDPELFVRWVGPNAMETEILDWDATTGGRWPHRWVRRGLVGAAGQPPRELRLRDESGATTMPCG